MMEESSRTRHEEEDHEEGKNVQASIEAERSWRAQNLKHAREGHREHRCPEQA